MLPKKALGRPKGTSYNIPLQVIICFLLAWFLFAKSYDPFQRNIRLLEYHAEQQEWNEVLDVIKKFEKSDVENKDYFRVDFQANRALSHVGQLSERIFEYPQQLGVYGLMIDANYENSAAITSSDLYFDLGYISEAQRWAFEAQTLQPNSPRILKRLVMINLVNRKYGLADEYLKILDKNRLYKEWVSDYQRYVADTILIESNKLIADKRKYAPAGTDLFINDEEGLKQLVETNSTNLMAYEYLMSYFLLDLNLTEFVNYLRYYKNYNIKKLPRSWGEALCLFAVENKGFPTGISRGLEPEAMAHLQSLIEFVRLISQYKNNLKDGEQAAFSKFGQTFWHYREYSNPAANNSQGTSTEIK